MVVSILSPVNPVKILPEALQIQDAKKEEVFMKLLTDKERSNVDKLRDKFYNMVTLAMQTICTNGRMVGGIWSSACGAMDGNKFVCFDKILNDSTPCLVYSFGAGGEISFEEVMAEIGCKVRLFDHTIGPPKQLHQNITYYELGIGHETSDKVMTLDNILKTFGDKDKEVSYLKVDVEGAEIKALQGWIESGAMNNVKQIGMEIHTALNKEDSKLILTELIECFQALYNMGFRLISYEANGCAGKDAEKKYFSVFEIVFYR